MAETTKRKAQKDTQKKARTCEPVPYALTGRAEDADALEAMGLRLIATADRMRRGWS